MTIALALVYVACSALCLAMPRHCQQLLQGRQLSTVIESLLRSAGWLAMAAGSIICVRELGIGAGLAAFFGLLSLAAPVLAILLTYAPRVALALVIVAPLAGL